RMTAESRGCGASFAVKQARVVGPALLLMLALVVPRVVHAQAAGPNDCCQCVAACAAPIAGSCGICSVVSGPPRVGLARAAFTPTGAPPPTSTPTSTPPPCGGNAQLCCSGSSCDPGFVCVALLCTACGATAQPCCSGNTCNAGLSCVGAVCVASTATPTNTPTPTPTVPTATPTITPTVTPTPTPTPCGRNAPLRSSATT